MTPHPPLTALAALPTQMADAGWAVLDARTLTTLCAGAPGLSAAWAGYSAGNSAGNWTGFWTGHWAGYWADLPLDPHLRDGGRYRRRRHGCFVVEDGHVGAVAHRAHWQPLEYNALHGGYERWFEPLAPGLSADPRWTGLLRGLAGVADLLRPQPRWFVEAHAFRIDTEGGIGRPTPEGAHRDGVDLVVVMLMARHNIKGGETRVFDARGPDGLRFTLDEPGSVLLLDDERMIHESTPIQPLDPSAPAWRDTLVLTFRREGFQGPAAAIRP